MAKKRIVESRTVVIVEGYTDVVMAHQFDCTNVVSVLGTALTEQHVALLKRFADRIVFLFDPDAAGDMAAERAVEVAITSAFKDVHIATLPDGADPDEFLLQRGRDEFEKIIKQAPDALSFRWTQMYAKHSTAGGAIDQESAVREFLRPFDRARLAGTIDPLRWGFILTRLSRLLEMPVEQLNRIFDLRKTAAKMGPKSGGSYQQSAPPPPVEGPGWGDGQAPYGDGRPPYQDRRGPYRDGRAPYGADGNFRGGSKRGKWNGPNRYEREREGDSLPPLPPEVVAAARKNILSARARAERWILGCLLVEPSRWTQVQQHVHLDDFTDPEVKALADLYWTHQRDEGEPVFAEFLGLLQDPAIAELAVRLVEDVQTFPDLTVSLSGALDHLTKEKERLQQQKLVAELRRNGVVDPIAGQSEVDILQRLQNMKKSQPNPPTPKR